MGGGGFSGRPGDPELDRYVLDQATAVTPRICLLPTASGDPDDQIQRFYRAFHELPCEPSHLSLFRLGAQPVDLRERLLSQDIIYVGGGSMANLLAIWRVHGLDEILYEAWRRGIVLCGISAGSMCWFRAGVTKSHGEPRAHRRARLPAVQQLRALALGARARPGLPRGDHDRRAAARLRRRRRHRAAVRRDASSSRR